MYQRKHCKAKKDRLVWVRGHKNRWEERREQRCETAQTLSNTFSHFSVCRSPCFTLCLVTDQHRMVREDPGQTLPKKTHSKSGSLQMTTDGNIVSATSQE